MRRRMRSKSNSMYSISMATAIDTFRFSIVCRRSRLPFGERHRTNHNLKCVQFPAMMWWSNNNLITKLHWVSGMKIKFYFLGAHSVKSHHVSVRWPLLFVDIIFFPFSCLPSWVVGVVRKPKILFSFSINTHTHMATIDSYARRAFCDRWVGSFRISSSPPAVRVRDTKPYAERVQSEIVFL